MTDQYEPKGPFRAEGGWIIDANDTRVAGVTKSFSPHFPHPNMTMDGQAFAARIADALNAQPLNQHSDDAAVDRFAARMKAKLAAARKRGRGGWDNSEECRVERLASMLIDHVRKGDPVDVGNFAMMLSERGVSGNDTVLSRALHAQERVKELERALDTAIEAIESLEPEALGVATDAYTGAPAYPIRDEVLDRLRQARALKSDGEQQ